MTNPNVSRVFRIIRDIESQKSEHLRFLDNRFPNTYAFDYMRLHYRSFGMDVNATRSSASRRLSEMVPDPDDRRHAAVLLAKAYLDETKTNMNGHSVLDQIKLALDSME